jgi:hypothetical protein
VSSALIEDEASRELDDDVDDILRKISAHGMASLTAEERYRLQRASEIRRRMKS